MNDLTSPLQEAAARFEQGLREATVQDGSLRQAIERLQPLFDDIREGRVRPPAPGRHSPLFHSEDQRHGAGTALFGAESAFLSALEDWPVKPWYPEAAWTTALPAPRDALGTTAYWERWTAWDDEAIARVWADLSQPSGNPGYEPQYCFNQARHHWEAMLRRYSAGRPLSEMRPYFDGLLRAWEQSVHLGAAVYTPEQLATRGRWALNLDLYISCFWMTGLALLLRLPEPDWQRLLALMGNEGEDALLDRVIAIRSPGRRVGPRLCHPQPYERLLAALDAPTPAARSQALADFVQRWHPGLDRKGRRGLPAAMVRPYWHRLGDENFEGGAYFGRWCVEAAVVASVFGVDDTACLGHPHYPGDLVARDGPSSHPRAAAKQAEIARDAARGEKDEDRHEASATSVTGSAAGSATNATTPPSPARPGFWARWFRR